MSKEKTVLTKRITINGADYTVTSEGKVFGKFGQPIKLRPNTSGYASFTAGRKGRRINVTIHRLVAESFLPNPNNLPEVDHKDSNRMNASLDNLEWVSHAENIKRAYERGNHDGRAVGEKNIKSQLNRELVMQMRIEYFIGKKTITEIARRHSLPWNTAGNAIKGITWKHIPMPGEMPM